jgi:hypothetical protein
MSLCIMCAATRRALSDELQKMGTSRNVSLFVYLEHMDEWAGSALWRTTLAKARPCLGDHRDHVRNLMTWAQIGPRVVSQYSQRRRQSGPPQDRNW